MKFALSLILATFFTSTSAFAICFNIEGRPVAQVGSIHLPEAATRVCTTQPKGWGDENTFEVSFAKGMGRMVRFISKIEYTDACAQSDAFCRTYRIAYANFNDVNFRANGLVTFHVRNGVGTLGIGYDQYPIVEVRR